MINVEPLVAVPKSRGRNRRPVCPQLVKAATGRPYPQGCYCDIGMPPGLMVPTDEEYGRYCSTPEFSRCAWYTIESLSSPANGRAASQG